MEPLDFSNLKASIWKLEFLHILKGFGLILPKIRPVALSVAILRLIRMRASSRQGPSSRLAAHPDAGFFIWKLQNEDFIQI